MAADRILVFARRPAAGRVKTRLTPPLPPDEAACVYEACLRDVIALAARQRAQVEIWYDDEPSAAAYFANELPHLGAIAQAGDSLGAKMKDAFERSFADNAERVIIIGTDSPTLPETFLNTAFDDLHESDAVIGPSLDGGYYLIGLRTSAWPKARKLFDHVRWSEPDVFRTTIERIELIGLSSRVQPGWYDIDTVDDLRQALRDAAEESNLCRWATRPDLPDYLDA